MSSIHSIPKNEFAGIEKNAKKALLTINIRREK